MSRFDTTNFRSDAKMYSVIGTDASHADELVQVGMVGKVGERIVDDIYEFLPLEATDTEVFYLATPEVDPDESKVVNNTLNGFKLSLGQVADAVQGVKHDKFAIAEAGVEGVPNTGAVAKAYVYAKVGKRQLQYSATKPTTDVVQLAEIEEVVPASQGMVLVQGTSASRSLAPMNLQYNILRCRIIA